MRENSKAITLLLQGEFIDINFDLIFEDSKVIIALLFEGKYNRINFDFMGEKIPDYSLTF